MSWGISSLELGEIATCGSEGTTFVPGSLSHEGLCHGAAPAHPSHAGAPSAKHAW